MIYLILAIFCSAMVAIAMRIAQPRVNHSTGFLAVNYLICSIFAFVLALPAFKNISSQSISFPLSLGIIESFIYFIGFVVMQWNIRQNGVVLSSAFMKLGILVPTVLSVVWFKEVPTVLQVVGFLLALAAIIIINHQKGFRLSRSSWLLIVLLLLGGAGDGMSKVYEVYGEAAFENVFLFVTFFGALLQCLGYMFYKKERIGWKELAYGTLLGLPNYLSTLFLLKSLSSVPAVIAFPTFSVGVILVVAVTGIVFFREKLQRKQIFGGILICIALAMLNI